MRKRVQTFAQHCNSVFVVPTVSEIDMNSINVAFYAPRLLLLLFCQPTKMNEIESYEPGVIKKGRNFTDYLTHSIIKTAST